MRKVPVLALALAAVLAPQARGVEIKNVRAANGPLGATRADNKFLPGDILFLAFDITDLKTDPKTGVASFQSSMEILDGAKSIFSQKPPAAEVPLFGGNSVPSYVSAIMALDQAPGRYKLKVSVTDKAAKATKEVEYDFELLKAKFGIVQPFTPAVGFVGQENFVMNFAVVGLAKDAKKMPDAEVSVRLLDEAGKAVTAQPLTHNVKELHVPQVFDLTTMSVVPVNSPLVLNRAGKFTIEIQVNDRLAKEQARLRLPLTVIDPGPMLGKTSGD